MVDKDTIRKYVKLSENIEIENSGSEYIVFNKGSDSFHLLNYTSFLIFNFCDGSRSVEDIVEEICKEFEIENSSDIYEDVTQTLSLLQDKKLIA